MAKRADEVKVGVMVMGAGIILLLTVFMMLRYNPFRTAADEYRIYLKFAGGLERDSVVRFGGMRRGKVAKVALAPDNSSLIEVDLRVQEGTPVKVDSRAKLAALSALGEYYVEISPGTQNSPLLGPGGTIPTDETPALSDLLAKFNGLSEEAMKLIVDLNKNVNQISAGANTLLGNLNEVTGPKNRKALEATLAGANGMIANANALIGRISPQLDAIAANLRSTTEKFNPLVDRIGEATSKMNSVLAQADAMLVENRPQIKKDLEVLEGTLTEARNLLVEFSAMIETNRGDIDLMLENFRRSSENMREFTSTVKQRPFSLIRIKPKPDRKVPK